MIRQGVVRAYSILGNGNEVNVALFGSDDYFPAGIFGGQVPVAVFYYEAMTDVEVEVKAVDEVLKSLVANPAEFEKMGRRYLGALIHIQALGQDTASAKIAQTLKYLALRFGGPADQDGYRLLPMDLTQLDLARLANISRETASHELTHLKSHDAIRQQAKKYLIHIGRLNHLTGDELQPDINL